jgi:(S)-mandelate dehydrogenase
MAVEAAINYDDLRRLARRRLPRIAFDFLEGGVDDEEGLRRNELAFRRCRLVPKYMVDTTTCDQSTSLFGRTYASPFGIAPTGGAALFRPGADLMLACAARDANVPFIISGASTATMEDIKAVAPDHSWYQVYLARDRKITDDMIARAKALGLSTLVLTVDLPASVRRERDLRNGFSRPMRPSWSARFEALRHPSWLLDYYTKPGLSAANWAKYARPGATAEEVLDFLSSQFHIPTTWADVEHVRDIWPRRFVVKGIMHPDDARQSAALGVDGIIVSNHGGRQLDRAPSPLEVLPLIRDAVGDRVALLFDSGIRRGSDIVTALCLGAKFAFVGRWALYGVTAGGEAGARHAVGMIRTEVRTIMAQLGAPNVTALGPDFLLREEGRIGIRTGA